MVTGLSVVPEYEMLEYIVNKDSLSGSLKFDVGLMSEDDKKIIVKLAGSLFVIRLSKLKAFVDEDVEIDSDLIRLIWGSQELDQMNVESGLFYRGIV